MVSTGMPDELQKRELCQGNCLSCGDRQTNSRILMDAHWQYVFNRSQDQGDVLRGMIERIHTDQMQIRHRWLHADRDVAIPIQLGNKIG